MSRLNGLVDGRPVFIIDLGLQAFFSQMIDSVAVVYDMHNNWYTVHVDNLAVLH